jgi:hypothetical protein
MPLKLLQTDIKTLLARKDFHDRVVAILREFLSLTERRPSKSHLRLVKKPPNPKS